MDKDVEAEAAASPTPENEASGGLEPGESPPRRGSSLLARLAQLVAALVGISLDLVMLGLTAASAFVAVMLTDLPETDVLKDIRLQEPLRVYTADGDLMAEFGVQRRNPVSIDEIPRG